MQGVGSRKMGKTRSVIEGMYIGAWCTLGMRFQILGIQCVPNTIRFHTKFEF